MSILAAVRDWSVLERPAEQVGSDLDHQQLGAAGRDLVLMMERGRMEQHRPRVVGGVGAAVAFGVSAAAHQREERTLVPMGGKRATAFVPNDREPEPILLVPPADFSVVTMGLAHETP